MTKAKRIDLIVRILRQEVKKFQLPVVEQVAKTYEAFYVLVSTMLSLRTKDQVTAQSSRRLFKKAGSVRALNKLSQSQIEKLIYPVGFYKIKAKSLKKVAQIIIAKYHAKVPDTEEALLGLPGVGRKTANLVLSLSYNKDAICVDTHVHRISNRFDLIQTTSPEKTEYALMKVLPRKYWKLWNTWLVIWGQNVCHPVSPKCSLCPLLEICPRRGVTTSR